MPNWARRRCYHRRTRAGQAGRWTRRPHKAHARPGGAQHVAGATAAGQGRVARVGRIAVVQAGGLLDHHPVVLDLAVDRRASRRQIRRRAAAEAGIRGACRNRTRHGESDRHHCAAVQRDVRGNLFTCVDPVAVAVEVDPGVEEAHRRSGETHHVDRSHGRLARGERAEGHAVLVVQVGRVIAVGGSVWLAVLLAVDQRAHADAGHDDVVGAVAGRQGRVGRIGRIAVVLQRRSRSPARGC